MYKKGQIYVLVALIMSVIIFGMVSVSNKVEQESVESDFEELSSNYAIESTKLINSLLGKDITGAFRNFTRQFTSYSKTKNPKFEIIYAFDYNNTIYIGNYLKEKIIIANCTETGCSLLPPLSGCFSIVPASVSFDGLTLDIQLDPIETNLSKCETNISYDPSNPITRLIISVNEVAYQFGIKRGKPELIIVSWESQAKQRKVFTEGTFVPEAAVLVTLSDYCHERCDRLWCTTDCKANCGLIKTEEECKVNSDCAWVGDLEKCIMA